MRRFIWAFIAFNVYSVFLIDAFQRNTPYIFDAAEMAEMAYYGLEFRFEDWRWDDHYIWRLVSAIVTTGFVGFLTGAIAGSRGAKTALIANIPSVLIWIGTFYFVALSGYEIEGKTGFSVISILAIPMTSWIAYIFGGLGEEYQTEEYSDETVLGIGPFHWAWAILPLYVYSIGVIFVAAYAAGIQFSIFSDISFVATVISLIALIPILAWLSPLYASHQILSGETMSANSPATRGLTVAAILAGGILVALLVQLACIWTVQKLGSWWYT